MRFIRNFFSRSARVVSPALVPGPCPVMVVGMHRSGTSFLTGSLQQAGLELGKFSAWNPHNLKGNRENLDIVAFNDAVLNARGFAWDNPPTSRILWTSEEYVQARELIGQALEGLQADAQARGRRHVLPVWYDPSVGPELHLLAQRSGLSVDEVIARHSGRDYQVFALGFAPGFAFMGLVEEALAAPRLDTPRKRVAAGSVGIAERQTAAYPLVSPGGWNLIGRTPAKLFDRTRDGYSLLQPGDSVRYEAVSHAEFMRLGGDDTPLEVST